MKYQQQRWNAIKVLNLNLDKKMKSKEQMRVKEKRIKAY